MGRMGSNFREVISRSPCLGRFGNRRHLRFSECFKLQAIPYGEREQLLLDEHNLDGAHHLNGNRRLFIARRRLLDGRLLDDRLLDNRLLGRRRRLFYRTFRRGRKRILPKTVAPRERLLRLVGNGLLRRFNRLREDLAPEIVKPRKNRTNRLSNATGGRSGLLGFLFGRQGLNGFRPGKRRLRYGFLFEGGLYRLRRSAEPFSFAPSSRPARPANFLNRAGRRHCSTGERGQPSRGTDLLDPFWLRRHGVFPKD